MTLSELVARTGVPASTIHHYLRLGLVPGPQRTATNRFRYDERHVAALRAVRMLREKRGLGLDEIAAVLPDVLAGLEPLEPLGPGPGTGDGDPDAAGRILGSAIEAFRTRGFAEVTIGEVAAAAGVAKGSVYRHFSSKEHLFAAAVERVLAETADAFAAVVARLGGPRRVTEAPEQAAAALAVPVALALPLLIEVGARAAKGHRPSRRLARKVLRTLVHAAGQPGAGEAAGQALASGLAVVNAAFAVVLDWALDPSTEPLLPAPTQFPARRRRPARAVRVRPPGLGTGTEATVIDMSGPGAYNG